MRAVLRITPVALGGNPQGAVAFYLEQALAGSEGAPYRQRVIVLQRTDGAIINALYRLRTPQAFIGFAGRAPLTVADLERDPGCDASWTVRADSVARGSAGTAGRCASTLRGATHVVSEFALTADSFTTLDQGLDDAGSVRWGPPAGEIGHVFVKRRP